MTGRPASGGRGLKGADLKESGMEMLIFTTYLYAFF